MYKGFKILKSNSLAYPLYCTFVLRKDLPATDNQIENNFVRLIILFTFALQFSYCSFIKVAFGRVVTGNSVNQFVNTKTLNNG